MVNSTFNNEGKIWREEEESSRQDGERDWQELENGTSVLDKEDIFSDDDTEATDNVSENDVQEGQQISRGKCFLRLLARFVVVCVVLFLIFLLIVWIGSRVQQNAVDNAPSTQYIYETESVCAATLQNETTVEFTTFNSSMTALEQEGTTFVANCGECGQCSNPQDVGIYADTASSLYDKTVGCARKALLQGREKGTQCMEERVGLTEGCTDCWMDNIMCDLRQCVFVCIWHGLWNRLDSRGGDVNSPAGLNPCTACDEALCGPEFVECAGANRRRSGLLSDIQRDNDREVCTTVTPKWWKDETLLAIWERQTN